MRSRELSLRSSRLFQPMQHAIALGIVGCAGHHRCRRHLERRATVCAKVVPNCFDSFVDSMWMAWRKAACFGSCQMTINVRPGGDSMSNQLNVTTRNDREIADSNLRRAENLVWKRCPNLRFSSSGFSVRRMGHDSLRRRSRVGGKFAGAGAARMEPK
jgi:hypothetical protein